MMPEAKSCDVYILNFCRKWQVLICKAICKVECKNIHATGKCLDDKSCHCYCC